MAKGHRSIMDVDSTDNPIIETAKKWDINSLLEKVAELQDLIVQAQERNVLLSAQTRELERIARDADDLKAELAAQGLLLTDKTKENKLLHQELSKVTTVLEVKIQEVDELKALVADLQHQLRTRESERDLLAVMLNEAENAQKRADVQEVPLSKEQQNSGWFRHFKGKSP